MQSRPSWPYPATCVSICSWEVYVLTNQSTIRYIDIEIKGHTVSAHAHMIRARRNVEHRGSFLRLLRPIQLNGRARRSGRDTQRSRGLGELDVHIRFLWHVQDSWIVAVAIEL